MVHGYTYGIWDGKTIIGQFNTFFPLYGRNVLIPYVSLLKQLYGKKYQSITVPIHYLTEDDGVKVVMTRVLDVRKKSRRQKAHICDNKKT